MKYVIYGSGAVGGLIGARLQMTGHEVVFLARGAHLEALRTSGLQFATPHETTILKVKVFELPQQVGIVRDDRVIVCTKTQDSAAVMANLAQAAPDETPVFCAQNGIESENIALRYFRNVYGLLVLVFGVHLKPGVVNCHGPGLLDIGRWPKGIDETCQSTAAHFRKAGFASDVYADIGRYKRGKLVTNLVNALNAACTDTKPLADLLKRIQEEARSCFQAAGLPVATLEEMAERQKAMGPAGLIDGAGFPGSSSWQSLQRGAPLETDYLNGEIAYLARQHNREAPLNARVQQLARHIAKLGAGAGVMTQDEVRKFVEG